MGEPVLTSTEFSTELEIQTGLRVDGHPLWASRFLISDPEACVATYKELLRSGACVIQTNTYQASPEAFVTHMGLTESEAIDMFKTSVNLCRRAVNEEKKQNIIVAGAVGSINAWRADGSEYSGEFCSGISRKDYISKHRPRVQALVDGGIDFFAFETLPCSEEALALIDLLKEFPGVKGWISFFGRNTTEISNGEKFAEAAIKCWERGRDQLVAVGVNCLDPAWVTPLFLSLKAADPTVPFVAYPNSGEKYDTAAKKWTPCESQKSVADYLPEWLDMGIAYVGGCCRNSAKDLRDMKRALDAWKEGRN
uniref:Homocysteine S-methyltransferase n=2 Tax=Lygus hesperus TaxID=30085 RepID=A0A0A9Z5S8_LYGHE